MIESPLVEALAQGLREKGAKLRDTNIYGIYHCIAISMLYKRFTKLDLRKLPLIKLQIFGKAATVFDLNSPDSLENLESILLDRS
jgi:hypothetical protein